MTIQRFFQIIITVLLFIPVAQGQIKITEQVKVPTETHHHAHQDSSYHCGMCDKHLFDSHEATIVDNTHLHYHGIGTDDTKSPLQCAGCKSHLGYFDHEHNHYQVLNENVDKKDGKFHCSSCQMPIFNVESLTSTGDSSAYFKAPISKGRIAVEDKENFYNITGSNVYCRKCNGRLGAAIKSGGGGFGVRVNLGKVKSKKHDGFR